MVRVEDVVKHYRTGGSTVYALAKVSLEVERGEFVAITGASGSGKSTLLHLLAGLDVPDEGAIYLGGQRLSGLSDDGLTVLRRRQIGLVFQFFNLLPMLSAEENVALPLLLDRQPKHEVRARVAQMLNRVGLWERRHHKPDELSGGQMQRVAIARALVTDPILLLADEPTGNLDSKSGEGILQLIKETAKATRQTVVMVTHDPRVAVHSDRIITLQDGRIVDCTGVAPTAKL